MQRVCIRRLESPLDARPLRQRDVAFVGKRFGLFPRIGRVGEKCLKISHRRARQNLKAVDSRRYADRAEQEIVRTLQVFECITIVDIVKLLHTIVYAVDNDGNLVWHLLTLNRDPNSEIFLLGSRQTIVFQHKGERRRTLVIGRMIDDASGRFRYHSRSNN